MAVLAADALVDSGAIQARDKELAAEVIGEEIAIRLDIGDYPQAPDGASEN